LKRPKKLDVEAGDLAGYKKQNAAQLDANLPVSKDTDDDDDDVVCRVSPGCYDALLLTLPSPRFGSTDRRLGSGTALWLNKTKSWQVNHAVEIRLGAQGHHAKRGPRDDKENKMTTMAARKSKAGEGRAG
jgi:hypothetical protein